MMTSQTTLTTRQAADYIGLAKTTLEKRRLHGQSPKFVRLGRAVRYRIKDLEEFLEANVRYSTSDEGAAHTRHSARAARG
jgi:excisionase family DNA binding protein